MTELKTRRRLISAINKLLRPHLWESGYVRLEGFNADGSLRSTRTWLWAPKKPKKLQGNEVATEIEAVGIGWVSMDHAGGGMAKTAMSSLPNCDLVQILCWLQSEFTCPKMQAAA